MFDQLKPILQNGERYIVVEGGKPEFVLMRFRDYVLMAGGRRETNVGETRPMQVRHADLGAVNAEIGEPPIGRDEGGVGGEFATPQFDDPASVRLEDLAL